MNRTLKIRISHSCPIYKDYMLWGLILSVILNYFGISRFYLFQIILILAMMFFYGINKSVNSFISFIRKYWIMTICFLIWAVCEAVHTGISSGFRMISIFLLIFTGYLFVKRLGEAGLERSLRRLIVIFIIMAIIGLAMYFTGSNPFIAFSEWATSYWARAAERLTSFWLMPIPEACYLGVLLILAANLYKGYKKIIVLILGLVPLLLTQTRSAWFGMVLILVLGCIPFLYSFGKKIKKRTLIFVISVLIVLAAAAVIFSNQIQEYLLLINERLFGESLSSDMSFTWRIMAIGLVGLRALQNGFVGFLFGHGIYSAGYMLEDIDFGSTFAYNVATVDNSYISALYDLGIIAFIWLVICVVWVVRICVSKKTQGFPRIIALCLMFLLIMAFFFEEIYWCNASFLLYAFMGVEMGLMEKISLSRKSKADATETS